MKRKWTSQHRASSAEIINSDGGAPFIALGENWFAILLPGEIVILDDSGGELHEVAIPAAVLRRALARIESDCDFG
jgi:hypothetical protein